MKPSFLDSSASSSSSTPDPQPNLPQKEGGSNEPAALDEEMFPNRPQKMGDSAPNPKSVPDGGKLPFGPAPAPRTPWKFGK